MTTRVLAAAATTALDIFERGARAAYGNELLKIVLFGSYAQGDGGPDSDLDLAVVLKTVRDRAAERDRLADIAYEAIVETSVDVHPVPISEDEWEHPDRHRNPALVRAIKRDGSVLRRS